MFKIGSKVWALILILTLASVFIISNKENNEETPLVKEPVNRHISKKTNIVLYDSTEIVTDNKPDVAIPSQSTNGKDLLKRVPTPDELYNAQQNERTLNVEDKEMLPATTPNHQVDPIELLTEIEKQKNLDLTSNNSFDYYRDPAIEGPEEMDLYLQKELPATIVDDELSNFDTIIAGISTDETDSDILEENDPDDTQGTMIIGQELPATPQEDYDDLKINLNNN